MGWLCDYNIKHLRHKYMLPLPWLHGWALLYTATGSGDMEGRQRSWKKETDSQMCTAEQEVSPDGRVTALSLHKLSDTSAVFISRTFDKKSIYLQGIRAPYAQSKVNTKEILTTAFAFYH